MRKADLLANHAVSSLPLLILYKIWSCPKFLRKNAQLLVRNCFLQLHGRNEVQMNQVFYFMGFPGVHSVCSAAQSCPTHTGVGCHFLLHFLGDSVLKNLPANAGDASSIPRSGRSSGEGNGNPLQYSCLEIPWTQESGRLQSMVLQSQTRLSD